MFDWFSKMFNRRDYLKDERTDMEKISNDMKKVIPFPESKIVPKEELPEDPEKPATIFYRFGITDKNRLAFQIGYSEIIMNRQGVQNLIDQLTFFMHQMQDEDQE